MLLQNSANRMGQQDRQAQMSQALGC